MLRGDAGDEAVDGERDQRARLEEAHQEADREVRRDRRAERAGERLAADAVALAARPARAASARAAAPMIGVASRNAKRAASLFESPTSSPPPIVAPGAREAGNQRERLRGADPDRLRPADLPRDPRVVVARRSAVRAGAAARRRRGASRSASGRTRPTAARRRRCAACSRAASPRIPAGIVPTTSSQPSFASVSSGPIPRSRSERPSPFTIRTQSRQKKPSSTSAVARCVATRKVRKYLSFWWMSQPRSCGRITLWPRLETGKSSETPCSSPEDDRLGVGDQSSEDHAAGCVRFGPGAEPGEHEAGDPEEERRDPVLDVVVAGSALVAREEAGQRLRGLDPVDDPDRDQDDRREHGQRRRAGGRSASGGA